MGNFSQICGASLVVTRMIFRKELGVSLDGQTRDGLGIARVSIWLGDHQADPARFEQCLGVLGKPADVDVKRGGIGRGRVEHERDQGAPR